MLKVTMARFVLSGSSYLINDDNDSDDDGSGGIDILWVPTSLTFTGTAMKRQLD